MDVAPDRRSRWGEFSSAERFWLQVVRTDGCWEWCGYRDRKGYGRLSRSIDGCKRNFKAHRFAYELLIGPIPDGLPLDHLCRNPACVKPDHLEPVTPRENWMRGFHPTVVASRANTCKRGHSLADAYVDHRGCRHCRPCAKAYHVLRSAAIRNGTWVFR